MGNRLSSRDVSKSKSSDFGGGGARVGAAGEPRQKDFQKSQSMYELGRKPVRRKSTVSASSGQKKGSASLRRNGAERTATLARHRSIRKEASANHPISASGREIVRSCFDNPHADLANRVVSRLFEKRDDYRSFIRTLVKQMPSSTVTNNLSEYLESVVENLEDVDEIARLSKDYGQLHVELKKYGFKPDFWVSLTDALTVEGVFLDMATHNPTDTVAAWSQLITLMFSSVRDGYYNALRNQRISSRRLLARQNTVESTTSSASEVAAFQAIVLSTEFVYRTSRDSPPAEHSSEDENVDPGAEEQRRPIFD
ncbi:hypothetical protein QR680_017475 [Steinernema hermaphroditum]|uniref:Globin family profile domain-containing protein n=1 Tax=Steinernema hermaphroditum TaxID=289476 RepID=A0AA39HFQ0_9BILA|nr:hypothetical protein QR680_017475 [Steinernema hermaphroditum]